MSAPKCPSEKAADNKGLPPPSSNFWGVGGSSLLLFLVRFDHLLFKLKTKNNSCQPEAALTMWRPLNYVKQLKWRPPFPKVMPLTHEKWKKNKKNSNNFPVYYHFLWDLNNFLFKLNPKKKNLRCVTLTQLKPLPKLQKMSKKVIFEKQGSTFFGFPVCGLYLLKMFFGQSCNNLSEAP